MTTAVNGQKNAAYPATGTLHAAAEGETLLRGVLVYGEGEPADVLVRDGVIAEISDAGSLTPGENAEILELDGQILLPGLIDMHVHLREPAGKTPRPSPPAPPPRPVAASPRCSPWRTPTR